MDAGVFHDAHEVYARKDPTQQWVWFATFAMKQHALNWVADVELHNMLADNSIEFEVRPV